MTSKIDPSAVVVPSASSSVAPYRVAPRTFNELVPVFTAKIGATEGRAVDARVLHEFLSSQQQFGNWIKNRISEFGFIEHVDYVAINNSIYSPPRKDYTISLGMAKELAMLERNEKGKQARRYFIEFEQRLLNNLISMQFSSAALRIPADFAIRPAIKTRAQLSFRTTDEFGNAVMALADDRAAWDVPRGLSVNKAKQTGKAYFAELKELAMHNPMEAHSALVELFLFGWRTPMETRHRKTEKVSIGGGESVQALKKDAFAHPAVAGDCGVEWSFLDALADAALLGVK